MAVHQALGFISFDDIFAVEIKENMMLIGIQILSASKIMPPHTVAELETA